MVRILLDNFKEIDLVNINNIALKEYIMDNLFHLYNFLMNEPNFIKEMNTQFLCPNRLYKKK